MSFQDEQHAEPIEPVPDAHRVLSHGDLVDLKQAAERGLRQVPEVLMARRMDNAEGLVDALGIISDSLTFVLEHLGLDEIDDDDDDEPEGTIVEIERITRSGGRSDA